MHIRQLNLSEYPAATALSLSTFTCCGTDDYDAQGLETFKSFIANTELMNRHVMFGAFQGDLLIGVIATKNHGEHISLLFVNPRFHRKGIGRKLFDYAYAHSSTPQITVNSSSHAIGFYQSLGFAKFMPKQVTNGLGYTPMKRDAEPVCRIRVAQKSDAVALRDLFRATVLTVNTRNYSVPQVQDWASCGENLLKWEAALASHYFLVAEDLQAQIVGFSSITSQGHLYYMYVHKDHQSRGIATMLLAQIEAYATQNGMEQVTSDVSLTARPFFEKHGYQVIQEQQAKANRLLLTNFRMVKSLR